MPRPTWDPTRPQDSEQVSLFPSLHRADKSTLKDVLGTLDPFGSTTTTWRQVQVGDDTWLVQNLYFDGTNWNRDDTTKASVAIGLRSNGTVTIHKVAAGSNPVGTSLPAPIATLDATSRIGSWRILGVVQPETSVTSVQFSELDLSPPVVLRLVMVVRNPTDTRALLVLRVNGETNGLDWAFQTISGEGTAASGFRGVDGSEIAAVSPGMTSTASCTVCIGPSGDVVANSTLSEPTGTDTPAVRAYCTMKNTTITSLSSIEIISSVTNGIASGSVFYLEYLAP